MGTRIGTTKGSGGKAKDPAGEAIELPPDAAILRVGGGRRRPLARKPMEGEEELRDRVSRSVEGLLDFLSPRDVSDALRSVSGVGSLLVLVDRAIQARPGVLDVDRDLDAERRLIEARQALVERMGRVLDTSEVAELLGISDDAVRKRLSRGRLLSYQTASGEHHLPSVQFVGGNTIEGLEKVLDAMHVKESWMRIQLFLDDDVLGALKDGRVEDAVLAADSYLPGPEPAS